MKVHADKSRGSISLANTHDLKAFVSRLRPGQILHGRVVKTLGPKVAVVEFAGQTLKANSSVNLTQGELIRVQIKGLDRPIVMKLMEGGAESPSKHTGSGELPEILSRLKMAPGPESLGTVKHITKGLEDLRTAALRLEVWGDESPTSEGGKLVKKLATTTAEVLSSFRSIRLQDGRQRIGEELKNLFTNNGYNYENHLKRVLVERASFRPGDENSVGVNGRALGRLKDSFKGRLLELRSSMPTPDALDRFLRGEDTLRTTELKKVYTNFYGSVGRLLGNIDLGQEIGRMIWEEGKVLYFQIPLELGEGNQQVGRFKVKYRHSKSEKEVGKENFHLAMLLDMPHLGRIDASVFIEQKVIGGSFTVSDHGIKELLKNHSQDLSSGLKEAGYKVGRLSFEQKPLQADNVFEEDVSDIIFHRSSKVDLLV